MLELQEVSVGYARDPVLRGLHLVLPDGGLTALIGPNGCGKSTLLRTACGLLEPSAGRVLLDGAALQDIPRKERARRIAFLPQSRPVPDLTARSLVLHGRFPYLGYPRRYGKADYAAADAALAAVGAQALAGRDLRSLSGGERQKVYIAMALAQDAPTILLDEPTTYLDIDRQFEVMHLLSALRAQGKTVVAVLHDLALAFRFADRVVLLQDGAVCADGAPDEVAASGALARAFHVAACRIEVPEFGVQYVFAPIGAPDLSDRPTPDPGK